MKRKISDDWYVKLVQVKKPTPELCKLCKYRASLSPTYSNPSEQTSCDYILYHGQRRGCTAGNGCTKFEPKGTGKSKKDLYKDFVREKAITCCFNCESKELGCHSTCKKYLEELARCEERRKTRSADADLRAFFSQMNERKAGRIK